jgi:hypothetical protein
LGTKELKKQKKKKEVTVITTPHGHRAIGYVIDMSSSRSARNWYEGAARWIKIFAVAL